LLLCSVNSPTTISRLHSGCAKIRTDDDHSRRHSSIPHALRCTGIAGRAQSLSICCFCRPWFRTSLELGLDTRRKEGYPDRIFRTSDIERELSYHPHQEVRLDGPFTCLPRAGLQSREKNHLLAPSLSLPARHAAQVAASLERSEKLVRRSIALDEACVPTAPRTIVLKRLKRQPK